MSEHEIKYWYLISPRGFTTLTTFNSDHAARLLANGWRELTENEYRAIVWDDEPTEPMPRMESEE